MVKKPPISGFPWHPKTLGEKILRKRLELGLTQLEVAVQLGVNDQTISRWETGESKPNVKNYPTIIQFLGYYPFDNDDSLGSKIRRYRFQSGITKKIFAKLINTTIKNVTSWESNQKIQNSIIKEKLRQLNK